MSNLSLSAKERIKLAFSRAALGYDRSASLQKEVANDLLKGIILPLTTHHPPFTNILDMGCGTGFLTYLLAEVFPSAHIYGCDIAQSMVKVARDKDSGQGSVVSGQKDSGQWANDYQSFAVRGQHKKIHLLTADGETLPYRDEVFHIVASNLTYQWVSDLKTAFLEAHRVLRPGGVFTFSTLGPGTLKELRACYVEALNIKHADYTFFEIPNPKSQIRNPKNGLPPFMDLPGGDAILSTLKMAGFDHISIKRINNIQTYPDMWAILKTLKSIGASNPFRSGDKNLAMGSILKDMAKVYEQGFRVQGSGVSKKTSFSSIHHSSLPTDHCIYATYEVLFVKTVKL